MALLSEVWVPALRPYDFEDTLLHFLAEILSVICICAVAAQRKENFFWYVKHLHYSLHLMQADKKGS